jgi:hypothetical protein
MAEVVKHLPSKLKTLEFKVQYQQERNLCGSFVLHY